MRKLTFAISFFILGCSFLDLQAQSYESPDWVVIMSKDSSISEQVYLVNGSGYFPSDTITKYISKGFIIDQVAGRGSKSFIVLTKYKNYSPKQDYKLFALPKPSSTHSEAALAWIKDRKKDGYRVAIFTNLYFKEKVRAFVVLNKEQVNGKLSQTKECPSLYLGEGIRCPERVFHDWQISFGMYYYVWNDVSTPYLVGERNYFPSEYLNDKKKEGWMIKHLSLKYLNHQKGGWNFILIKNPSWTDQVYYYQDKKIGNPSSWIQSNKQNGFFITSIF